MVVEEVALSLTDLYKSEIFFFLNLQNYTQSVTFQYLVPTYTAYRFLCLFFVFVFVCLFFICFLFLFFYYYYYYYYIFFFSMFVCFCLFVLGGFEVLVFLGGLGCVLFLCYFVLLLECNMTPYMNKRTEFSINSKNCFRILRLLNSLNIIFAIIFTDNLLKNVFTAKNL